MVDADTLRAVVGQIGTLVMDHHGAVLSSTGELAGAAGEAAAKTVLALLQDSNHLLERDDKEVLERLVVNFSSYDFVLTLDNTEIYVVKRSKSAASGE